MTDDSDCTEGWQEMERRRWTTKTFSVGFDNGTLTEWLKVQVNVWEHQQQWLGNGTGLATEGDLCEVKFAVLVGHISRAMWQAVGKSTEASMAWWLHKEFLKQVLRNHSNRNEWESLDSKHWLDCALLYIIQHYKKSYKIIIKCALGSPVNSDFSHENQTFQLSKIYMESITPKSLCLSLSHNGALRMALVCLLETWDWLLSQVPSHTKTAGSSPYNYASFLDHRTALLNLITYLID